MSKRPLAIRCLSEVSKKEEIEMRVLVLAKEGEPNGSATPPTPEAMAKFQKFNDDLIKVGVVVGSGRLSPSSQGKRVRFDATRAPSSTGRSLRPRSSSAATGCGRCPRSMRPSRGSSGHHSTAGSSRSVRSYRARVHNRLDRPADSPG